MLLISMIILTFSLMLSGGLLEQALKEQEQLELQITFQGLYDIGVHHAELFVNKQSVIDLQDIEYLHDEISPSVEARVNTNTVEQQNILRYAKQYLSEADHYYTIDKYSQKVRKSELYEWATIGKEPVTITNKVYTNDDYRAYREYFKDILEPLFKEVTDYEKILESYLQITQHMGKNHDDLDHAWHQLKEELEKKYQFILFTHVQQPIDYLFGAHSIEQPIISLLSYKVNEEQMLTYQIENLYTLKSSKSEI